MKIFEQLKTELSAQYKQNSELKARLHEAERRTEDGPPKFEKGGDNNQKLYNLCDSSNRTSRCEYSCGECGENVSLKRTQGSRYASMQGQCMNCNEMSGPNTPCIHCEELVGVVKMTRAPRSKGRMPSTFGKNYSGIIQLSDYEQKYQPPPPKGVQLEQP